MKRYKVAKLHAKVNQVFNFIALNNFNLIHQDTKMF